MMQTTEDNPMLERLRRLKARVEQCQRDDVDTPLTEDGIRMRQLTQEAALGVVKICHLTDTDLAAL